MEEIAVVALVLHVTKFQPGFIYKNFSFDFFGQNKFQHFKNFSF